MNQKFFGNSLDLFKYDVLLSVIKLNEQLFYIPMLTSPKEKLIDPKYLIYEVGSQNLELKNKMETYFSCESYEFDEVIDCFNGAEIDFRIIIHSSKNDDRIMELEGLDKFFNNEDRKKYFKISMERSNESDVDKLIFLDPDIGLDLNVKRNYRSMKDAYLKVEELKYCFKNSKENDVICFFQHLGNHRYSVKDRLKDLKNEFGDFVLIVGYRRILGSLVFIFKNQEQYEDYFERLKVYLNQYEKYNKKDHLILE